MVTDDHFLLRRVLVSASGLIYWIGVLIQARRVRRHIGRSPNLKPRGLKERLLWLGWFIVILTWIFQPVFLKFPAGNSGLRDLRSAFDEGGWASLLSPPTLVLGAIFIVAGYACTLWCYRVMGDAWRIGVNKKEKNALITLGPYRSIRHPIYAFQILMLIGAFLLLPTVLSLAILLFHFICVLIKAADEEAYLLTVHGDSYKDYLFRTGRLFPRMRAPKR
jgi:protein-S-isoprenylcysteine O-methyltransferase Ste14